VIPLKSKCFALALLAALAPVPAFAASLEQMAGQMIVVGFAGNSVDDKSVMAVRDEIANSEIGGVMYLKTNVASQAAVKAMNAAFRAASPKLPPFLTLDQEGGAVERLTKDVGFEEIPNAQTIAADDTPAEAGKVYGAMADSIAKLGFTVNFGPVIDLNVNPSNPIIGKYGRSFSKNATTVTAYAGAFIKAHRQAGLLTALKHFPGHGSSTTDSHQGFVDITKTWDKSELEPYRALIGQGLADFVMVGHLYDANYDPVGDTAHLPASLSPVWIEDVLRNQIGYKGVVISDDLEMGAIRKQYSTKETVIRAVNAGVDVLLFSNTAAYSAGLGDQIRGILVAEAKADPKFAARIEESYNRIVALKGRIGQ
jgi:beta-N-acetylhexosaminidase